MPLSRGRSGLGPPPRFPHPLVSPQLKQAEWAPDFGPSSFVPSWGATATGARKFLLAFNINLLSTKEQAHRIALNLREQGRGKDQVGGACSPMRPGPSLLHLEGLPERVKAGHHVWTPNTWRVGGWTHPPRCPCHAGLAGSGFQGLRFRSKSLRTFSMEAAGLQLWPTYCSFSTLIRKQALLSPRYPQVPQSTKSAIGTPT